MSETRQVEARRSWAPSKSSPNESVARVTAYPWPGQPPRAGMSCCIPSLLDTPLRDTSTGRALHGCLLLLDPDTPSSPSPRLLAWRHKHQHMIYRSLKSGNISSLITRLCSRTMVGLWKFCRNFSPSEYFSGHNFARGGVNLSAGGERLFTEISSNYFSRVAADVLARHRVTRHRRAHEEAAAQHRVTLQLREG